MTLTERERATLVVALRVWQNELSYYTLSELREYYPALWDHEPLSIDEVERLLARVREGAAGTVRPSAGGGR